MADSHSSGDYSDVVSRRKFVSLAGTTGAAAVAGCIGGDGGGDDDDDGNQTDPGTGSGNYPNRDIWFNTFATAFVPDQFQYNPAVAWFTPHDSFGVWAPWTKYLNTVDEFVPHLIQEWEVNDTNMVLTLSEEFTWGDSGDSITAEDLVLQLEILDDAGDAVWDLIEGAEASSEFELTVNYSEETNPQFVEYSLLQNTANYAPSDWEDAEYEESPADVTVETPDPSGPLALTEATSNYNRMEPRDGLSDYEDSHLGPNYNWNGYQLEYREDNNAGHQSFIANEMDGIHSLFVPPDQLDNFPDTVRQFQIPGNFGMAIWPDHSSEPWNIREVRQAFYWSLDREAIVTNVGASTKVSHHPTPTGLTWATIETFLGGPEEIDGFTTYTRDVEQAQSLLDETDYSMGDIDATITYPAGWSDWAVASTSAIDQLSDAGWDASGDSRSGGPGSYVTDLGSGIVLGVDQHTPGGQARHNLPYFSFDYIFRNRLRETEAHFANYTKNEVEIDGNTINIDDSLDELASTTSQEDKAPVIEDLAQVVNKDVPVFYIMEKYEQSFVNTDDFAIPESSDQFNAFWPMWWLPKVDEKLPDANENDTPGLMKAKPN